jgi:cobalt-zinc-cadmium efflux system outer membrane protein
MSKLRKSILFFWCFAVGVVCKAGSLHEEKTSKQENNLKAWTLTELVVALKENNPQLRSAYQSAKAVEFGVSPAQALDNPTLSVTQDPLKNSPFSVGTSTGMTWGVSQNFMWPGKKRLAGEIVQSQAELNKEQANALKVQLIGQLKSTWIGWQQTTAQIGISQAQLQRIEQIKEITKIRYANNAAAYGDYINAQVAQAQMQTDVLSLQRQKIVLQNQLALLIGSTGAIEVMPMTPKSEALPERLVALEEKALSINPQVKSSQFSVDSACKGVELAELGKLPDFSVGVMTHSSSPPWGFGSGDSYGLNLGVTFPLYYGQKERGLLDQAKANLSAAKEADEALKQQVVFGVRASYHQWVQSVDQLKIMDERVLKQAQIGYRLVLSSYSTGQVTYLDLLNAFNALKTAEISREQTLAQAIQAKVTLDTAVGDSE